MRGRGACTTVALAALVLGSCSSGRTVVERTTRPTPTARGSSSPLRTAVGDTALVDTLDVQQGDVPNGYTVVPVADGDRVQGTLTLDLCDASFPSEKLRTTRRQVAVADSRLQNRFSTEAVLYQSPAATEEAFAELRDAQEHCPPTFHAPANSDVTPLKTTFNPPPDVGWPDFNGVDRLAFDVTLADEQGRTFRSVTVYLRRGRALLGLYFPQTDQPLVPIANHTSIQTIVGGFAGRLIRLPAGAVS